jgi:hypothetical protein
LLSLKYRGYHVDPDDLQLGECTIRPAAELNGSRAYYRLWFYVNRDSDGQPDMFSVPLNPNGGWIENGPGGKTWGFNRCGAGEWQVSPSINVLTTRDLHPGLHPSVASLWHQTPKVIGAPDGEPWMT